MRAAVAGLACAVAVATLMPAGVSGVPSTARHCAYVEAGAPGPVGNRLEVSSDSMVRIWRDGPNIVVRNGPRCTGMVATVHNTDRIVLGRGRGISVDESNGRFAPGATREDSGSEIEIAVRGGSFELQGTGGRDAVQVRTLPDGRVALNTNRAADGRAPDYDVILLDGVPDYLKIRGYKGDDRIDARRLRGMGDNQLRRVIRLLGDSGNDTILGSPGGEWRLQDGPGDDLVVAGSGFDSVDFGRGHDTIYGGPGDDDLIYSAWEGRFTRQPADSPDRIFGGGGEDQIIDLNRHSDLIRCGSGRDEVERDSVDRPAADCEHLRN